MAIVVSLTLLSGCATVSGGSVTKDQNVSPSTSASTTQTPSALPQAPVVENGIATVNATEEQLAYLIEEEKLAHDVYTKMFELWGARVFGNILNSEQSHQGQVLVVMQTRNLKDPRSPKLGVFANKNLQSLYDQLIAKGKQSAQDAYEVGITIEELDIDDLTKMLATAKDTDVIAMMENLRRGSENHLRAFNNQI